MGGLDRFVDRAREEQLDVQGSLKRAYELARRIGRIVGRVSRYTEVSTTFSPQVEVDVDPRVYYGMGGIRVGDYLAVVDPKTLRVAVGVVAEVRRSDELAESGIDRPLSPFDGVDSVDPNALITTPRVKLRLLVEGDLEGGQPVPASTSVDPQSPVVDPEPWVIEKLLSLGSEGVVLGALASPGGLVKGGSVAVRLPYRSLLQHVLVIGTTGSGKTTLLKNLVAYLSTRSGRGIVPVILDMNEDFVQLPLPGSARDDPVYRGVYEGAGPPSRVVIVLPLTVDLVDEVVGGAAGTEDLARIAELIVSEYSAGVIEPLTGRRGSWKCRVRGGGWPLDGLVVCESGDLPYKVIPYTIVTVNPASMPSDSMAGLMPGVTRLAQDLLKRLREHYKREKGVYPPLQALIAAAAAYLDYLAARKSRRDYTVEEHLDEESDQLQDLVSPLVAGDKPSNLFAAKRVEPLGESLAEAVARLVRVMDRARPHKGTVEALYRKLQALADSGVADVAVSLGGGVGSVRLMPEPPWKLIVEEASRDGGPAPVVVDLHWPSMRSGGSLWTPRLVAYRALERLIAWKHSEWASRRASRGILVIVDEAHQFFPQEKGEEAEANRQVAAMISRLARLGRARGVGIVFSTHSPSDLHDIILQLANTKIVLRTEKSHAEKVGVPSELRDMVPYMADRFMVVMSHVFRGGFVIAATSKPITMHYDVSASMYQ